MGVYYICASCDQPIAESSKQKMILAGEWIATATAENPNHIGFHCNRLISPWVNWIDMAYDYESSKNDPLQLQVFVNSSLGLPFEREMGESLDWEKLHQRSETSNYQRGEVPEGVLMLTAGVDVQGDRLEVSIWGWGRGEQSWLIDHQQIFGDPIEDDVWQQLSHIIGREYRHASGKPMRTRTTCVDSGYLTHDVYMQVRKRQYLHLFAIKGQARSGKLFVNRPRYMEISYRGKVIERGIKLYVLGVDSGKETIYSRTKIENPGSKYINFPKDMDTNYFQGFCSEIQVKKHRAGQVYFAWEKLPGVHNNEPLDCALYALAAAHLAGLTRMNWSNIEKNLNPKFSDDSTISIPEDKPRKTRNRTGSRKRKNSNSYTKDFY